MMGVLVAMPLELPLVSVTDRAAKLNHQYHGNGAVSVLSHALSDPMIGRICLVSSFGAESVVLLHLISIMDPSLPILFIDSELLFTQTLTYQTKLAAAFGLTDIRVLRPKREALFSRDPENLLHLYEPDACCDLRKVEPLAQGLAGFDGWITGRKRYHGGQRQALSSFEAVGDSRIKINPLAHWARQDLTDYIENNNLPRHPLVAKGFTSIGCKPCTSRVDLGEDSRAGRWRKTEKTECGIHFAVNRVAHEVTQ